MTDALNVYLNHIKVGELSSDQGRMLFRYDPEYLERKNAEALSFTMPLSAQPYGDDIVSPYFSNLLPDEGVRQKVAKILQVSPENTFGLLKEIGEDCAGAVSLFVPGRTPQDEASPLYRELSEDDANSILSNLDRRPLNVGDADFRISGAGAQNKLVACVFGGKVSLPLRGTPSTHIIKPGIPVFEESVFNEYFCMKLAAKCQIPVPDCGILRIKGVPYYLVARFDRVQEDGKWTRLHQEDFCQLLHVDPKVKYESEGGPGIQICAELLQSMELPGAAMKGFIRRVIFNFLIGNGDAHAKNFSILYRKGKPELAPAYDLLSTLAYPDLSRKLAMKIGGEYNFRWITPGKFDRMATQCDVKEKLIRHEVKDLAAKILPAAQKLETELAKTNPSPIYAKIVSVIRNHMGIAKQMEAQEDNSAS